MEYTYCSSGRAVNTSEEPVLGELGVLFTGTNNNSTMSAALTELGGNDGDVVPGVLLSVQLPEGVH